MTIDAATNMPAEAFADSTLGAPSEPAKPAPGPWKFWGTTLWFVALVAVFVVIGSVWMAGITLWSLPEPEPDLTREDFRVLLRSHLALEVTGFVVAAIASFAVLWLAIRLKGMRIRDYLGLTAVRGRDIKFGLLGLVAIYVVFWFVYYLVGHSPRNYVTNLYRGAAENGLLPLVLIGVIVVAPFVEEVLIRGFLYRGWAASRLGPIGAVVLTAAVWTALHTQYEWPVLLQIFCLGLLLGAIRRRGGSTTSTMALHAFQNTWSFVFFEFLDKFGMISP